MTRKVEKKKQKKNIDPLLLLIRVLFNSVFLSFFSIVDSSPTIFYNSRYNSIKLHKTWRKSRSQKKHENEKKKEYNRNWPKGTERKKMRKRKISGKLRKGLSKGAKTSGMASGKLNFILIPMWEALLQRMIACRREALRSIVDFFSDMYYILKV